MKRRIRAIVSTAVAALAAGVVASCRDDAGAPPSVAPSARGSASAAGASPTSATPTSSSPASGSAVPGSSSAPSAAAPPFDKTPEGFARSMTGTIECGKQRCVAGKQVCVVQPNDTPPVCRAIERWVDNWTPSPQGGLPSMAGITACQGSDHCPAGSVCCVHESNHGDTQAVVCHASLDECRDVAETCASKSAKCRTPKTKCDGVLCVPE